MTVRTNQLLWIKEATHSKIHTWESEAEVYGWKKTLVPSLKQFHACFYQLYEKGMTWAMVGFQGLHTSDAFRCSTVSDSMGLKSFWPWCLKLGGVPKWFPSMLERCITGWLLCVTYASCSLAWMHRASWTTTLDVKPSATRNMPSRRDRKSTRKNQSPGNERRCPNYPAQRSSRNHKEQNATQHLLSSPARGHKLVHFLNLSGSSLLYCLGDSLLSQTNCHFFLQPKCL